MRRIRSYVSPLLFAASLLHCGGDSGEGAGSDGTGVVDPSGAKSGTRLQLKYYASGDARQFRGIVDTMTGDECAIESDEAGTLRCFSGIGVGLANFFTDATCTSRVALVFAIPCASTKPTSVTAWTSTPQAMCAPATPVKTSTYDLGQELSVTQLYMEDGNGKCVAGDFVRPDDKVYAVTKGDATKFVSVKPETRAIGSRLAARVYVGDDGSVIPVGSLVDAAFPGDDVYVKPTHEGAAGVDEVRYLRDTSSFSDLFSDEACTSALADLDPCADPSKALFLRRTEDLATCSVSHAAFGVGAVVVPAGTTAKVFRSYKGSCTATTVVSGASLAATETPATLTAYVRGVAAQAGTGRIRRLVYQNDDGSVVDAGSFFDTKLGARCEPFFSNDAVLCVGRDRTIAYSDAACTKPVGVGAMPCGDTPAMAVDSRPSAAICGSREFDVYLTTKSLGKIPIFTKYNGNCVPQGDGAAFEVTRKVELSELATLTP